MLQTLSTLNCELWDRQSQACIVQTIHQSLHTWDFSQSTRASGSKLKYIYRHKKWFKPIFTENRQPGHDSWAPLFLNDNVDHKSICDQDLSCPWGTRVELTDCHCAIIAYNGRNDWHASDSCAPPRKTLCEHVARTWQNFCSKGLQPDTLQPGPFGPTKFKIPGRNHIPCMWHESQFYIINCLRADRRSSTEHVGNHHKTRSHHILIINMVCHRYMPSITDADLFAV